MPKFVILLILIGTTTFLCSQTEAKPFLFLPPNFFTLTTRAPTTTANSLSTAPPTNNLFQLPLTIIQRKLNFITNLVSSFISGGNLQFGLKLNAGISTQRPSTTTEMSPASSAFFRPVLRTTTAVLTNAPHSTVSSTERTTSSSTTATTTTTANRELSPINPNTETSEDYDQNHSTEKSIDNNFEKVASTTNRILDATTTTVDDLKPITGTKNTVTTEKYSLNVDTTSEDTVSSRKETTSTEKPNTERAENSFFTTTEKISLNLDSTSEKTVSSTKETSTREPVFTASTKSIENPEFTTTKAASTADGTLNSIMNISTAEPLFTANTENVRTEISSTTEGEFSSTTTETVTQQPLLIATTEQILKDSTPNRIMILTTEAPYTVKPTIVAQQPVISTTTENLLELIDSTTVSTPTSGSVLTTGFDDKVHTEKKAEVVPDTVQSSDDRKNSGGVSSDGYKYQKPQVSDDVGKGKGYAYNRPRPDSENELFIENISRMYLPVL
ncbi:mucin-5AC [Ceratitis capitata]|uniref:mucin-5AC n=1 Tax=Ceratitis capitata TaxID=7213 RepID=UPI0006188BE8|nr:mucin-5AC [Ceratitis capitata]